MLLKNIYHINNNLFKIIKVNGNIKYNASGSTLLQITNDLLKTQTSELDKLCSRTLHNYFVKKSKTNNQLPSPSKGLSSYEDQIKYIYSKVTQAKVGFLKGDIHAQFIYKLKKHLQTKKQSELKNKITQLQYRLLLNEITQLKSFRLPKKSLDKIQLEDQDNLFQRQLITQTASYQQSCQNYFDVLDNLVDAQRVHQKSWFTALLVAIQQQQIRCKNMGQNVGKRKKYAQYFTLLNPQKLTLVCLNQLFQLISQILFKGYSRKNRQQQYTYQPINPQQNDQQQSDNNQQYKQFGQIRVKTFSQLLSRLISIQIDYQEKQKQFKNVMKLYDHVKKLYNAEKKILQQQNKNLDSINSQGNTYKSNINIQNITKQTANSASSTQQNTNASPPPNSPSERVKTDLQMMKQLKKQQYRDHIKTIKMGYTQNFIPQSQRKRYLQQIAIKLLSQHRYRSNIPKQIQQQIGNILLLLIKQNIKVKNQSGIKVPLLTSQFKIIQNNEKFYEDKRYKINHYFLQQVLPKIQKQDDQFIHLDLAVPTLIQPMPWHQYRIGGYYHKPTLVMRFINNQQQTAVKFSDQSKIFKVLTFLGTTPWKINRKILTVVQALWENGGGLGEIPKRYSQSALGYVVQMHQQKSELKKKQIMRKIQKIRDEHSLRCDFNLKLQIARAYSKLDKFYFPHNLDFRGRVYPVPPHFNHIGSDLVRGLLLFGNGVKLGKNGLKWLKIHCANLMGKDKSSIAQKILFIDTSINLISTIASDPLKHQQWKSYQDCWQALSAIIQLHDALNSDNPEQFVSHMHIHQDGSCNGLQHYAALGRDLQGAYQVNLGPTDKPGDVYTHVAKMVSKMIQIDVNNPSSENHEMAKKVISQVKRKTIKQTVMTSVYGVTFMGAKDQIYRQIKDQNFLGDEGEQRKASKYLAKYTLQAISNLFSNAHQIKKWLLECAKLISNQGNPVSWFTPMGLPVIQPYRASHSDSDAVNIAPQKLELTANNQHLPVNKSKQQSAFPPNYIHSLDSTHMMYTAQRCEQIGITYAAVHDSYWTHAGSVQIMNKYLRQEFIKLHSQPLLQNLKKSFQRMYPLINFPPVPTKGNFNLETIKQSTYFFS